MVVHHAKHCEKMLLITEVEECEFPWIQNWPAENEAKIIFEIAEYLKYMGPNSEQNKEEMKNFMQQCKHF